MSGRHLEHGSEQRAGLAFLMGLDERQGLAIAFLGLAPVNGLIDLFADGRRRHNSGAW
ncbi:MAG: hypothetical protein J0I63_10185 [Thiobacillus sp.]|nr:hypothetical protein [Thiobacillus sp.]